jgi:hypothetical protein
LGAGFTKSLCPDAPLNDDLVNSLKGHNNNSVTAQYANRYGTNDIEYLLTQLDLKAAKAKRENDKDARTKLEDDRFKIESELACFFEKFRFGNKKDVMERNPWFNIFANQILKQNDVLATLNYDCLLEGILDQLEIWYPQEGAYGHNAVYSTLKALNEEPSDRRYKVKILKLHGSEHFGFSADAVHQCSGQKVIQYPVNEAIYPRSGSGKNFGNGFKSLKRGPGLIAPSFIKTFHWELERNMLEAISLARQAQNFIVIGTVVRPEDSHINLIMRSFLDSSLSTRKPKKFLIVGPNASELERRLGGNYFGKIPGLYSISKKFEVALLDIKNIIHGLDISGSPSAKY